MECTKKMRQDKRTLPESSEPNAADGPSSNFDLIPIFPNEITLGPFMACIPWHMKPLLMTLNKTWATALNSPQYAIPQPHALKNSIIFYTHTPTPNVNSLALGIYQEGVLRRLPTPPDIPAKSYELVRFFVTHQCVYALTPSAEEGIYTVYILDLGGGMTKWRRLPPLPNLGQCIYISSNNSDDGNCTHDCIWMRDDCIEGVTEEKIYLNTGQIAAVDDADDWFVLVLHAQKGECQSIPSPPPPAPPLENFEYHPPEYLDIYTDSSRPRHLYKLFRICEYNLELNRRNMFEPTIEPACLLVFNEDYDGIITGVHCIRKQVNVDGSMKLHFYQKILQKAESLVGEELDEFYKAWRNFLPNWRLFIPEQIKAVKFTADLSERMDEWQCKYSLPTSKGDGWLLNERSTIKVAQQGPMYIYAYIATKCTNMYFQGEDEVPIC